jgi:hypothetical protein
MHAAPAAAMSAETAYGTCDRGRASRSAPPEGAARDASHPSEQEHRTEALEAHPDVLAQRGEGGADQTDE